MTKKQKKFYQKVIDKWGVNAQLVMVVEECSELIKEITKEFRGGSRNIIEEIADVEIMVEQLRVIYGVENVDKIKGQKLKRLYRRLNEHK